MFAYAPSLTWIVIGSFLFYIGISAGATPLFRRRLDEKFNCGAENQAFLVETVAGIDTLKAMAVEPQMQRRWEEPLAGYVARASRYSASATGPARRCSLSAAGDCAHAVFWRLTGDHLQPDGG
jgi:ABC-type bacteriocin/lantibiotic exporter with double-glycine peptidase domain